MKTSPDSATHLVKSLSLVADGQTSPLHLSKLAFAERTSRLPQAFIVQRDFDQVSNHADLVPDGYEIRVVTDIGNAGSILAVNGDATTLVEWIDTRPHYVTVSSSCSAETERAITVVRDRHPVIVDSDRCEAHTWSLTSFGAPTSATSAIDTPAWDEVSRNYSAVTRSALDSLIELDHPPEGGPRLLLWHGAPGTGKTTAIRALARQWSSWCDMHILADPEALLTSPRYLEAALTSGPQPTPTTSSSPNRQRLIVIEDCDAVLDRGHNDVRPALSRLLNSADGLSDHGRRAFVLITTNNPAHELHPALIRPGRCRAIVEFTPLTETESNHWLPDNTGPVTGTRTLAELCVHAGLVPQIKTDHTNRRPIGFS